MEALQHITSKQSQTGQKPGASTQVPHNTLSMAGGITTRATIKSDKNKDTRKQLEVQRSDRWANTRAINKMFPQAVTKMMRNSMTARSHGPLPLMLQTSPIVPLSLKLPWMLRSAPDAASTRGRSDPLIVGELNWTHIQLHLCVTETILGAGKKSRLQ